MPEITEQSKPLTPKQAAFVAAYIGEAKFNGTKAAKMAGYSARTAYSEACRLLKNAEISARVRNELAVRAMPAEAVLAELTDVATAEWGTLTEVLVYAEDGTPLRTRMDLSSKVKALELLGKHHQLFSENLNLSGGIEVHEFGGIPAETP